MDPLRMVAATSWAFIRDRSDLALDNLARRQQLAVYQYKSQRPKLRKRNRLFRALMSRNWPNWRPYFS